MIKCPLALTGAHRCFICTERAGVGFFSGDGRD